MALTGLKLFRFEAHSIVIGTRFAAARRPTGVQHEPTFDAFDLLARGRARQGSFFAAFFALIDEALVASNAVVTR